MTDRIIDYVTLDTARLLEKAGYSSVHQLCAFVRSMEHAGLSQDFFKNTVYHDLGLPTYHEVLKWFRDVHNLHVMVSIESDRKDESHNRKYHWELWNTKRANIVNPTEDPTWWSKEFEDYDTFEEAQDAAVRETCNYIIRHAQQK